MDATIAKALADVVATRRKPKFIPGQKVLYQEKEFVLPNQLTVTVTPYPGKHMPDGLTFTEQVDWISNEDNATYMYELFPHYVVAERTLNAA